MTRLSFSIPGEPKGKGRPRAHARIVYAEGGNGEPKAVVSMHTPADTARAERAIRKVFRDKFPGHRPWAGAVMIRFTAVFAMPTSLNKAQREAAHAGKLYATKKPDKDNIEKLLVDALNTLAWVDDCQVMGGGVKRYGQAPRMDVVLELLESPDAPPLKGERDRQARVDSGEDLAPRRPVRGNQTKSESRTPDLNLYPERARARIEAALRREEQERGG